MSSLSSLMIDTTKGNDEADSIFSCNLISNAKKHLEFLKLVHEYHVTLDNPNCSHGNQESFRRYHELWLPLVAVVIAKTKANPDTSSSTPTTSTIIMETLYPPPDIAWLWHCHRLAPKDYVDYCRDTFGGIIIEAHPPFAMVHPSFGSNASTTEPVVQKEKRKSTIYIQRTMDLWTKMYPLESFFLDMNKKNSLTVEPKMESSLLHGFDLLGSTERQANFFWQVSGERFGDDDF